jgi:hypothetical protein
MGVVLSSKGSVYVDCMRAVGVGGRGSQVSLLMAKVGDTQGRYDISFIHIPS